MLVGNVVIMGGGPAGALCAAYLATHELAASIIVVTPTTDWHCTYCTWIDDVCANWIPFDIFRRRWDDVRVVDGFGAVSQLDRSYGWVHAERLVAWITGIEHVRWVKDTAVQVLEDRTVRTSGGLELSADIVVDCTGHFSKFTQYADSFIRRRFQVFYGEQIRCKHGRSLSSMELMNWEMQFDDGHPPSFVYVLTLDEETLFMEETVLATDCPVPYSVLKARLDLRKARLGFAQSTVLFVEQYSLPMGGSFPIHRPGRFAFGAAAHMVHPATGYMFSEILKGVGSLAESMELQRPYRPFSAAVHVLNDLGAFMLCGMHSEPQARLRLALFFRCMFRTPRWYQFMARRITLGQYVSNMAHLFVIFPHRLSILKHVAWYGSHVLGYALRRPRAGETQGGI